MKNNPGSRVFFESRGFKNALKGTKGRSRKEPDNTKSDSEQWRFNSGKSEQYSGISVWVGGSGSDEAERKKEPEKASA